MVGYKLGQGAVIHVYVLYDKILHFLLPVNIESQFVYVTWNIMPWHGHQEGGQRINSWTCDQPHMWHLMPTCGNELKTGEAIKLVWSGQIRRARLGAAAAGVFPDRWQHWLLSRWTLGPPCLVTGLRCEVPQLWSRLHNIHINDKPEAPRISELNVWVSSF